MLLLNLNFPNKLYIIMNRNCLNRTGIFISFAVFSIVFSANPTFAQQKINRKGSAHLKLALNAYSFYDLLLPKEKKTGQPDFTLLNLLDWCAEQNIEAIDPTGYFFPGYPEVPTDEYINQFKRRAFQLGIDISGTGIRNNFASTDSAVRAAGVKLAKEWIVVASKLGAPVLRVFAGEIPKGYENKWDEVAGWMVECYKECAVYGEKYGVLIGIQNHGDMLQTADQCIKILKAVDSDWVGLIVDIGNFKTKDPYADIEAVAPFAVNWQIKESVFGKDSNVRTDFTRLIKIINKNDYRGYLPVETLVLKGRPYNPFILVPELIRDTQVAIDKELIK
jgi:sugar phosphate isomerase/epimerase